MLFTEKGKKRGQVQFASTRPDLGFNKLDLSPFLFGPFIDNVERVEAVTPWWKPLANWVVAVNVCFAKWLPLVNAYRPAEPS